MTGFKMIKLKMIALFTGSNIFSLYVLALVALHHPWHGVKASISYSQLSELNLT